MSELDEMLGHASAPATAGSGEMPVGLPMPRDSTLLGDLERRVRVTRGDRGVEIDLRDPGMLRKELRGNRVIAPKERVPKDLVGDFLERGRRSVERFEQRWPAREPAFARERMLDSAQREVALVLG